MQVLRAHRSLKVYKHFFDSYVKNVWVFQHSSENQYLKVLYFRAFVYHSFTTDTPYEVCVSLNGMFMLDNVFVFLGKVKLNI